jgi:hypothetical protein
MNIPFVLSAASLVLVVFSFFFLRRYIARKTAAREMLADYREEVYRLIAEIDAAADRDSLLVEERIKTLKKLIDDTDRRIGVYMRELQRSREGEAMYTSLGRGIRAALDSRTPPEERARENAAAAKPEEPPQAAPPPAPPDSEATPQAQTPQEPPASARKRGAKKIKLKTQIAELAAQGLSPQKIASRLKLSIAEVDLALNLLRRNSHE